MEQANPEQMERRAVLGVLGGSALLGVAAGAGPAAAAAETRPPQAWASRSAAVKLLPPAAVRSTFNPMDYLLVQEAFCLWAIAHDEVSGEVLDGLFTDDAVFEVVWGTANRPMEVVRGRQAIVEHFLKVLGNQHDQHRQCITNVVIQELTPTKASAVAYCTMTIPANGLSLGASMICAGDLRRDPKGHWRFSRLQLGMDYYSGLSPGTQRPARAGPT